MNALSSVAMAAVCLGVVASARPARAEVDRDKLLGEPGVYATFAVYELDRAWHSVAKGARAKAPSEVAGVIKKHGDKVTVDMVLLRGLTSGADVLVRVHSAELANNQALLVDLGATTLGRHLIAKQTWNGLTKKPNYVPGFSDDLKKALKTQPEPGAKTYAVVVPIKKAAAWWAGAQDSRNAMMKEHTQASISALVPVKRKLYHASGLSDLDFITYFETDKLDAFNELILSLFKVKENLHNQQFGSPLLLGTIHPVEEVLGALAR